MLSGLLGIPVAKVAKSMILASLTQDDAVAGYTGNKALRKAAEQFDKADVMLRTK